MFAWPCHSRQEPARQACCTTAMAVARRTNTAWTTGSARRMITWIPWGPGIARRCVL
ncbi:hypothetical protein [Lysobacter gummosus]|uniref:hypothetical protein n=1 Tax=Lysobacter gummosus TaxID=262324 RepID=UPI00363FB4AE